MKNTKKLLLVAIFSVLIFTFFSCKFGDTNQNNSQSGNQQNGQTVTDSDVIYSEDYTPSLILGAEFDTDAGSVAMQLFDIVAAHCGEAPQISRDNAEKAEREIVLGDTNRAVSKQAAELLNKEIKSYAKENGIEATDPDIVGFSIVSDSRSLAIIFNDEYINEVAFDYLKENYLSGSSLKLAADHVYVDVFSLTEYVDERDEKIIEEKWAAIESEIGGETGASITKELKSLYALYSDNVISWLANLYDPVTGGFYHSNSGRNNYGFLPDIESTYSALSFMDASGMNDDIDGNFADVLPDDIKKQIINFVYNLQDADGYFYHPQWGKAITDGRRGRDLSSATIMLKAFNVDLKYPYPGSVASVSFTGRLSNNSAVVAASRIIAVATVPEKFQSEEKFVQWLDSMNFKTGAYHAGSDLQSMINEMQSYGKSQGIDFMGIAVDYLNNIQNQSNGLWHTEVNYYGTNGLHKIAYFYNQAKAEFPNAEKAIKSAFNSLLTNETPSAAVDVYNAWSCVGYIVENIKNYADETEVDNDARASEIIAEVRVLAPNAIAGTANKLALFAKQDGSFSYLPKYSTPTAEGCKVALANTEEGDINGTGTIINATVQHIFAALDIAEYIVPRYTTSDRFRFLAELSELGEIIKTEYEKPEPYSFEDDNVGEIYLGDFYASHSSTGDGIYVVEHDRGADNKKVLRIDSNNDGGDVLQFKNKNYRPGAYSLVFEGDVFIDEIDTNYVMTISLLPGYMLAVKNISGRATLFEETTNQDVTSITRDLGIVLEKKTWYTLKIEYFLGDHETVRTVVSINGKAVAVSDGYRGKPKDGSVGVPPETLDCVEFYIMGGKSCTLLLDNLNLYYETEEYEPMVLSDEKYLNVDDPNSTWGIAPEGTKVNQTIELDTESEDLDTAVFEATLNFTEATGGSHLAKVAFLDAEDNTLSEYLIYCQDYDKSLVGNPRYRIRVYKDGYLSGANVGNKMEQDITFRIEYCWCTGEIKVITNNAEMTATRLDEVSEVPVAKVVFTNLEAYSKFTYKDVKAENIATGKAGTVPEIPVKPDTVSKDVTSASENANTLVTEFKINYSKIASAQHMTRFSFLDKDGNAINSITLYCQAYDPTNATESEKYRIRPFNDASGYLSGANVANKIGMDITVRIEYNWTTGEMKVYTNGNLVEYKFSDKATSTPVASVKLEALLDTVAYTAEITVAEAVTNATTPPEEDPTDIVIKSFTDATADGEDANNAVVEFTVNYSSVSKNEPLAAIELLDADGKVINTIYLFCNLYDNSQTALSDKYRIRVSGKNSNDYIALIGAGLGNRPERDVSFALNFNYTEATLTITCNGNVGSTLDISSYEGNTKSSSAPATLRFTPLSEDAVYTVDFTRVELNKI